MLKRLNTKAGRNFGFALMMIVIIGCGFYGVSKTSPVLSQSPKAVEFIDYGNGVYYLPYEGLNFGDALSEFISNHPDLSVVSVVGDVDTFAYRTQNDGYWVICKPNNSQQPR